MQSGSAASLQHVTHLGKCSCELQAQVTRSHNCVSICISICIKLPFPIESLHVFMQTLFVHLTTIS